MEIFQNGINVSSVHNAEVQIVLAGTNAKFQYPPLSIHFYSCYNVYHKQEVRTLSLP